MITLIGHGYVGSHIAEKLTNFNWITHKDAVPSNTSFIINAAGYVGTPNVDACEINKMECINANVLFPLELEKKFNVPIIHVSTGCLYMGYKDGGWLEDDEPNFNFDTGSFYNGCKGLFESLMKPYFDKSYLFRIRLPFGVKKHSKNLLTKYETYNKLVDFRNSITSMEDLVECVLFFIKERPKTGLYNVCNVGSTSTKEIVSLMNLSKEWMSEEEFNQVTTAKRSNCILNVDKLSDVYKIKTIEEALDITIKNYGK